MEPDRCEDAGRHEDDAAAETAVRLEGLVNWCTATFVSCRLSAGVIRSFDLTNEEVVTFTPNSDNLAAHMPGCNHYIFHLQRSSD